MRPGSATMNCVAEHMAQTGRAVRLGTLSVSCILSVANPVHAVEENPAAVARMVELCATGPTSLEGARAAFADAGWTEAQDGKPTVMALASLVFAFQFDAAEPGYSALNAQFMAASILGNSALGPNQLGFSLGEVMLGVLGIEEGTPYCVVTGPEWILDAAPRSAAPQANDDPVPHVQRRTAAIADGAYADALMDLDAVAALDPSAGSEQTEGYRMNREQFDTFIASIGEATMHINSKLAMQER